MRYTTFGRRTLHPRGEQYDRLDEISRIELGIPHEANARALDGLLGGLPASFDPPVIEVA